MKELIVNKLHQPIVVMALLDLTRLLVRVDFNMAQAAFIVAVKGLQYGWRRTVVPARRRLAAAPRLAAPEASAQGAGPARLLPAARRLAWRPRPHGPCRGRQQAGGAQATAPCRG